MVILKGGHGGAMVAAPKEYTGMLDCARKTVSQHGPQGLYRGALPLILGSSGKQAARWTGYETAANAMKAGTWGWGSSWSSAMAAQFFLFH